MGSPQEILEELAANRSLSRNARKRARLALAQLTSHAPVTGGPSVVRMMLVKADMERPAYDATCMGSERKFFYGPTRYIAELVGVHTPGDMQIDAELRLEGGSEVFNALNLGMPDGKGVMRLTLEPIK